jgi:nitrile hydratase
MGGATGFGAVRMERDEPVFHERWQGRVFGLFNLAVALGLTNVDRARSAIESHDAESYLRLGYYGRWLEAAARIYEESGWLDAGELDRRASALRSGTPVRPAARRPLPPTPGEVSLTARRASPTEPCFAVGSSVRARDVEPRGHTRLPAYVRGRRGEVIAQYGAWVFPDAHARGDGEQPQHVYCVRFDGRELWGTRAEAGTSTHVDLFESYLEPAQP